MLYISNVSWDAVGFLIQKHSYLNFVQKTFFLAIGGVDSEMAVLRQKSNSLDADLFGDQSSDLETLLMEADDCDALDDEVVYKGCDNFCLLFECGRNYEPVFSEHL